MTGKKLLITLAMVCLLAVPAYSMPWADGMGFGKGLGMADLTEEELESMTLAEIKELKEQKRAEMENMTLAEIKEMREAQKEERAQERDNMTLAELKEQRQNQKGDGQMGCGQMKRGDMDGNKMPREDFGGACLLMMDLTKEELESMTLAEIKELREQKMDELNNMTVAEIDELKEQKRAEMENMTLAELKDQFGMCGMAGFGGYHMDGQRGMAEDHMEPGRGTDQFGKNGPVQGPMGA